MNRDLISRGPVTLGSNVFGWTLPGDAAPDVIEAFLAAGGTHIDTADTYPSWAPGCVGGESETAIGIWLAKNPDRRDEVCLATKVGCMPGREGLSADNIRGCVDDSLARLQVDRIDVLYFHMDDPKADMTASVRAAADAITAGKVAHLAVSNYPVQRLEQLLDVCDRQGAPRPVLYQGQYHLLNRAYPEQALAPRLRAEGIPFLPHSSLANGFLTGKYSRTVQPAGARAGIVARYFTDEGWAVLDEVHAIAAEHDASPAAVALAWTRSRPGVVSPAVSVSAPEQLAGLMTRPELSDEDLARLDRVSQPYAAG
ncbi:aldo/keto reductase [Streptacidiphilus pinicola]|uniref:aldo/keto reductase n=1 Tax=Streptacidiphilus pinicola TaxID=2219663 RepID=UPI001402E577|nr:aldo/keto reductase [Streptacidiphilus pinicola]